MKRIGIFFNAEKEKPSDLAKQVIQWLFSKNIGVDEIPHLDFWQGASCLDGAVCIGGDGSLIKLASVLAGVKIPVLGVNAGRLGFLTNVKVEQVFNELECFLEGDFSVEDRRMLDVKLVRSETKASDCFSVLNDAVISREGLTRFLDIVVEVEKTPLARFGGDGLVVATPTGSSAYSLSAGGPFLYPTLKGYVITPLCAHSLRQRPFVMPNDIKVSVSVVCENADDKCMLTLDGHQRIQLKTGDLVFVSSSKNVFQLVQNKELNYCHIVNEKF